MITDDGSITGVVGGGTIVRDNPFFMTDKCASQANWGMAVCDETFAMVYNTIIY